MTDRPHWRGNKRADGVEVRTFPAPAAGGHLWGVYAPEQAAVTFCPCCGSQIRTFEQAKRIADWAYSTEARDE